MYKKPLHKYKRAQFSFLLWDCVHSARLRRVCTDAQDQLSLRLSPMWQVRKSHVLAHIYYHFRKSGTYSFGLICVCVCTQINVRKIIVPWSQKKTTTRKQLDLSDMQPKASRHTISGHYQSASKTPLEWRFACGPIVTRYYMLTCTGEMGLNPWYWDD